MRLVQAAASSRGLTLMAGRGNEGDTLGKKLIYVYDSVQFPFHPAEVYHQFHDDMVDKYSREYHDLKRIELQDGRWVESLLISCSVMLSVAFAFQVLLSPHLKSCSGSSPLAAREILPEALVIVW